ncbi:MAG: 2-dehydro-3-deoxy-6-phosphogalactonate aldolase [Emcibacteraceae bacterium]|nr:2-dehydro-3-deoxy-6-phosphogalactonate aldolase [Emcibacteraceae bacterium]
MKEQFELYRKEIPVVAIIRGVTPDEVIAIGCSLIKAGIKLIEVPLNSPKPFESIKRLTETFGAQCITGAGTVLTPEDVSRVKDVGGNLIVSPNTNLQVIKKTLKEGLIPFPGFATASEAFSAYEQGARHLKLFPASTYGIAHVKALKAVLPNDIDIYAVGGVNTDNAQNWLSAGVSGFGIGSDIYKPGDDPELVYQKAKIWVNLLQKD